jgi:Flp pilus assembly protein TadG
MSRLRTQRRRGNALLEFALAFSLIFLLLGGTFRFGYAFYVYNKLQSAVRSGARYASLRSYDSSTAAPSAAFLAAVRNMVVYNSPEGGSGPVVSGLSPDAVGVQVTFSDGVPGVITVVINRFEADVAVATLRWTAKPASSFSYQGRFAP